MAGKSSGKSSGGGIVRAPKGPAVKPGKAPAWAPAWGKGGKPEELRGKPAMPELPTVVKAPRPTAPVKRKK